MVVDETRTAITQRKNQQRHEQEKQERTLRVPHDSVNEFVLLAAVVVDKKIRDEYLQATPADMFYGTGHAALWRTLQELDRKGLKYDPLTMRQIGGHELAVDHLEELIKMRPVAPPNIKHHIEMLHWDHARVRTAAGALTRLLEMLKEPKTEGEHLQRAAQQVVDGLTDYPRSKRQLGVAGVLDQWRDEGPLVHEPTGIATLDELTGGGPVYGTRWYLVGAPDAGKTALALQLAHLMAKRGVAVGILAVDEEPGDLVMRLGQRMGIPRRACEERDPTDLDLLREKLGDLPIRFYGGDGATIERAAHDLATYAKRETGGRAMLVVDSLQTVRCDAERGDDGNMSVREAVTQRAQAIRDMATKHLMIVLATCEMNRLGYNKKDASENTDDLASAAESRAVEYSARVLLALRSVAGEKDLVELKIAKNKHGRRGDKLHLQLDRARQNLVETTYDPELELELAAEEKTASRDARNREQSSRDAGVAAYVIATRPGLVGRELEPAIMAALGCGRDRARVALAALGASVVTRQGQRRATHHYLDGIKVPSEVMSTLSGNEKTMVQKASPPQEVDCG